MSVFQEKTAASNEPEQGQVEENLRFGQRPLSLVWLWLLPPLLGALAFVPLQDYDMWWHLAIGRDLLQGVWPWRDAYSWTHKGQPLSFVPWLPSLYFYGVWWLAGFAGLVFLQGLQVGLWLGLSLRFHWKARSATLWVLLILLLAFPLVHSRLILLRSQFVLYLWLPWAAWLGWYLQKHPESRWKWAFVPWLFLWVQSHASFALGLVWIGLVLVWPKLVFPEQRQRFWKEDTLVLLASFAVCFLTPSGLGIFSFFAQHAGGALVHPEAKGSLHRYTMEAVPFRLKAFFDTGVTYLVLIVVSLPAFLAISWRIYGGEKLVWLLIVLLPFRQGRFVGEVGLFAFLFLPRWLTVLQADAASRAWAKRALWGTYAICLVAALGMGLGFVFKQSQFVILLPDSFGFRISKEHYPTNTAMFLEKHQPQGRFYNFFGPGSYLIWNAPKTPVYIDGRTLILYKEDFFYRVHGRFYKETDEFPRFLEEEKIDVLLIGKDGFSLRIDNLNHWAAVALDENFILYLRSGGPNDDLIKKYAYYYLPKIHKTNVISHTLEDFQKDEDIWKIVGQEIERAIRESVYSSQVFSTYWRQYRFLSSKAPAPSSAPSP